MEKWIDDNLKVLLLAPAVMVLLGLTIFPTIYMFTLAFQEFNPDINTPNEFTGLANFARMWDDNNFHNALSNTLLFTFFSVTIEFFLGLGMALLLDKYLRKQQTIKTFLTIPMMLPPIAVAITWKIMYQPQFGVLNDLLIRLGFDPLVWASGVETAMLSLIIADVWEWTPFVFLMMLAGLASLPEEPYEAAEIDGASAWRKFMDITLPYLKPIITITLLLRIMDSLRLFDLAFILTRGGPAGATETLSLYIFKVAFRFVDIGYAAAISLFVLVITVIFSTWFIRRMELEK